MTRLTDSPFLMLVLTFLTLWACAWIGAKVLSRYASEGPQAREDFRTVLAACLTLLGLIVGFSFSKAVKRIQFFYTRDEGRFRQIDEQTARLQQQMWSAVRTPAVQPNQFTALAVSEIAILCNLMVGVSARHLEGRAMFVVLPLVTAIAFFLIADIDSPAGGGVIHVIPRNLRGLGRTMR